MGTFWRSERTCPSSLGKRRGHSSSACAWESAHGIAQGLYFFAFFAFNMYLFMPGDRSMYSRLHLLVAVVVLTRPGRSTSARALVRNELFKRLLMVLCWAKSWIVLGESWKCSWRRRVLRSVVCCHCPPGNGFEVCRRAAGSCCPQVGGGRCRPGQ